MLTLTRKPGQEIVLVDVVSGARTVVRVVEFVRDGPVTIGIDAPDSVDIWRGEVPDLP